MLGLKRAAIAPLVLAGLVEASPAQAQPSTPTDPPAGAADPTVEAVTVNGTRAEVETSIDRRSYSVANDLSAQTGSVADALRNIPAVQVDAQGNPSLLGQGAVTILLDGRPSSQFSGQSLGQALQAMPADRIERIEVMTNPPAEYRADGAGGIINLVMKKARGAGATGSLRLKGGTHGRASATASLGYNSARLSVTGDLTVRRAPQSAFEIQDLDRLDAATGAILGRQDVSRARWTMDYAQGHASLDYDLDSRTRVIGSLRYTATGYDTRYADRFVERDAAGDVASALDRGGDEDEVLGVGEAMLTWRRSYGEGRALTLHAEQRLYEDRYRRLDLVGPQGPAGSAPFREGVTWTDNSPRTTLTTDYEGPAAGGTLKLGYDFERAPKRTDQDAGSGPAGGAIVPDPARRGVFLDTETVDEAYVSYERAFGPLTLVAGLRAKDLRLDLVQRSRGRGDRHDYRRLYPNLRLAHDLGEGGRLTVSFSRRTNVPYSEQLDPLPLSLSPVRLTAGNPDLRPEDAYGYELGYERRRGERLTTWTLFYRDKRDAFSSVTSETANGAILQATVNAGAVRRAGGEWALAGKLTPRLGYSLSLDGYWIEIAAAKLGFARARSAVTGFGRAAVNWQMTPKDLVQISLYSNGKVLRPQGHQAPTWSGNVGYRRVIDASTSWMLVVEDPFRTLRDRSVEVIDGVENRRLHRQASQSISLAIVWNFAGKPKDAGFEFGSGGAER